MPKFSAPPLDRSTPMPLYYQIAEALRLHIQRGDLKPGPPFRRKASSRICSASAVPRYGKPYASSPRRGLVRLQRPRGTFVTALRLQEHLPELVSFTTEVEHGLVPRAERPAGGV